MLGQTLRQDKAVKFIDDALVVLLVQVNHALDIIFKTDAEYVFYLGHNRNNYRVVK